MSGTEFQETLIAFDRAFEKTLGTLIQFEGFTYVPDISHHEDTILHSEDDLEDELRRQMNLLHAAMLRVNLKCNFDDSAQEKQYESCQALFDGMKDYRKKLSQTPMASDIAKECDLIRERCGVFHDASIKINAQVGELAESCRAAEMQLCNFVQRYQDDKENACRNTFSTLMAAIERAYADVRSLKGRHQTLIANVRRVGLRSIELCKLVNEKMAFFDKEFNGKDAVFSPLTKLNSVLGTAAAGLQSLVAKAKKQSVVVVKFEERMQGLLREAYLFEEQAQLAPSRGQVRARNDWQYGAAEFYGKPPVPKKKKHSHRGQPVMMKQP